MTGFIFECVLIANGVMLYLIPAELAWQLVRTGS